MAIARYPPTDKQIYPAAHLLGVPLEIRFNIYDFVVKDIHEDDRDWQRNISSKYDGLLLTCRHLSIEAREHIFYNRITLQQSIKLQSMPRNSLVFAQFRSLHVEIDLSSGECFYQGLASVLHRFQLSLQELGLLFHGQDCSGRAMQLTGCAKRLANITNSRAEVLTKEDQDAEKKLIVLRQLTALRNLRVLIIENANLPILQAAFMVNKPSLRAVSIRSDPRSIIHSYADFRKRTTLLRSLLEKIESDRLPPVRTLEIDANAVTAAADMVQSLSPGLQHLSWRVPNADHQPDSIKPQSMFYSSTVQMIRTLTWRAPKLETLRLCVDMRDLPTAYAQYRIDMYCIFSVLREQLASLSRLQNFELHYSGADEFRYLQRSFIACLPHGLRRLYISDSTIATASLYEQIYKRYLTWPGSSVEHEPYKIGTDKVIVYQQGRTDKHGPAGLIEAKIADFPIANYITINQLGQVDYTTHHEPLSQACMESMIVVRCMEPISEEIEEHVFDSDLYVGEARERNDYIPLDSGNLGFVTFDYDDTEGEIGSPLQPHAYESHGQLDCTLLFRMNGRLLDREHNMHLATQEYGGVSIKQPNADKETPSPSMDETATTSRHTSICIALHNDSRLAPAAHLIEARLQELNESEILKDNGEYEWYFGNEDVAQIVFANEPVAKAEHQRSAPTVMKTKVDVGHRCQWTCPDAKVEPVGAYDLPPIPKDWQD